MNKVRVFLANNATRVYALGAAVLALVVKYVPGLPVSEVLGIVAAALLLLGGEVAQRSENRKAREAEDFGYDSALDDSALDAL